MLPSPMTTGHLHGGRRVRVCGLLINPLGLQLCEVYKAGARYTKQAYMYIAKVHVRVYAAVNPD